MYLASVFIFLSFVAAGTLRAEYPTLEIKRGPAPGSVTLSGSGSESGSQRLELSYGLKEWWPVFVEPEASAWSWDWDEGEYLGRSFFRLVEVQPPVIPAHRSWKNQITLPGDDFLSEPLAGVGSLNAPAEVQWVKFALILDGLPKVYFQKSADYPFHFPFATERLSPFLGMDLEAFNAVSLFRVGQEVVLGAVLWAPRWNQYGIQFVGQDQYPREMLRLLFETVAGQLTVPADAKGFYMPTFEQTSAADQDRSYLAGHGIEVSTPERWIDGNQSYSQGWALGRLVFVRAEQIEAAYVSGDLLPTDILLTDGVSAEIPYVAGIISLVPTTPNSHVAILAQSYGIPFVYIRQPADQDRVKSLAGGEVALRTRLHAGRQIDIFDADFLDPIYRDQIVALKEPLSISITPMSSFGAISVSDLTSAVPEDIATIGGKAANFGFLRRTIPDNSPEEARAFTFDLWNAYLDQILAGGRSLREEIDDRLSGLTWPTSIPALDVTLRGIRDLIEDEADFSPAQRTAILNALTGLDSNRKIRFRSSTNVEDSGVFVGAGLYDSYSGCIADDIDGDETGPSHCDPTQPKERGVFRAMRRVYASFYNLNAFVERLRHGVEESNVGMGILAHYSFPDAIEAANGVATSELTSNYLFTTMVSQVGAESVTNPTGGSIPEIVELSSLSFNRGNPILYHRQRSNRLLLGEDTVMTWKADYQDFGGMFSSLVDAYKGHFPETSEFTLEFEYKKLTDESLVLKQIREVPKAEGRLAPEVALINRPVNLKILQGEWGTVFGNHRLKSLWQVESDNRWVDPANPLFSLITAAKVEYVQQGAIVTRDGAPSAWPNAIFDTTRQSGNLFARDRWNWPSDGGNTTYELWLQMPSKQTYLFDPIKTVGEFRSTFKASYKIPLPDLDLHGNPTTTSAEEALLVPGSPDDPLSAGSILVARAFMNENQVSIETSFYWPPAPTGIIAGYTAPLKKWVGTTITGLTTQPVYLDGYFSQTYRPGHHNFNEEFLFEPELEPGIAASNLAELKEKNIRMIYFSYHTSGLLNVIKAVGFDGSIRDL